MVRDKVKKTKSDFIGLIASLIISVIVIFLIFYSILFAVCYFSPDTKDDLEENPIFYALLNPMDSLTDFLEGTEAGETFENDSSAQQQYDEVMGDDSDDDSDDDE